jgi:nitroreductase
MIDALDHRKPDHPVEKLFVARWSPRAMTGQPLSDADIKKLFEAARWAPSTYNEQEWRFLYARRDTPYWQTFFDLLVEGNRAWCKNAGMLVVILAKKTFTQNGKPNPVHLFDVGAAFENIALQGSVMNLVIHGMQGFDFAKARTALHVPDDFDVAAMFAAGHPAPPETLPEPLRSREQPSDRKPISQITCEGPFHFS